MPYSINIVFFTGHLGTLREFIEDLCTEAEKCGVDYYMADATKPDTYCSAEFFEYISRQNTVMFTINNFGIRLVDESGENTWKKYRIPVFDFINDHPRNYDDILLSPPCDIHAFCIDRSHMAFIRDCFPEIKSVHFLPNGGKEEISDIPFKKRKIDVLYTGSATSRVTYFPPIDYLPEKGKGLYNYCISYLMNNPTETTEDAISNYLKEINANNDEYYSRLNLDYAIYIENTVRRYFKIEGIKALSNAGIKVEIYGGETWKEEDCQFGSNVTVHDFIPYKSLFPIIADAKITICYIPWYKNGCSEKNFDAMLNGSLCVTDKSKYLEINYRDGYNIVFFDLREPHQMAADVRWLLDNPEEAEIIAKHGYDTAKKFDTWESRFNKIVNVMMMCLL